MPDEITKPTQESASKPEKQEPAVDETILESLKDLPPEVRKTLEMFFSMQQISDPLLPPFLYKINEQHITQALNISEKASDQSFKDAQQSRWFNLIYFLIPCVLLVLGTWYLVPIDKDLYKELLKYLGAVAAGFGGGLTFKTYWARKKE
jgi:hypothetical protein